MDPFKDPNLRLSKMLPIAPHFIPRLLPKVKEAQPTKVWRTFKRLFSEVPNVPQKKLWWAN
jgi:hypothetical protein